jgi:hypothetical protein
MSDLFNKAIPTMRVSEQGTEAPNTPEHQEKNLNRQLGAQKAWAKRRAKQAAEQVVAKTPKPVSDRHKFDTDAALPEESCEPSFTLGEAIILARLIVDHPFLRKLLK